MDAGVFTGFVSLVRIGVVIFIITTISRTRKNSSSDINKLKTYLKSDKADPEYAAQTARSLLLNASKYTKFLPKSVQDKIEQGIETISEESIEKWKQAYNQSIEKTAEKQFEESTPAPGPKEHLHKYTSPSTIGDKTSDPTLTRFFKLIVICGILFFIHNQLTLRFGSIISQEATLAILFFILIGLLHRMRND